ncbi:hypothetical protein CYMTET_32637 [Cymbomonas tetramitiformis]|uniref:ShKT domain-containing protein n=1 Tax=Cymbomonas tetramitiformis TaxID=36881 RepID=A0AAE0FEY6_9CHLO|nr:hypothetical protein CYMTET_32637 [Cymbomonas tetramitiformis]
MLLGLLVLNYLLPATALREEARSIQSSLQSLPAQRVASAYAQECPGMSGAPGRPIHHSPRHLLTTASNRVLATSSPPPNRVLATSSPPPPTESSPPPSPPTPSPVPSSSPPPIQECEDNGEYVMSVMGTDYRCEEVLGLFEQARISSCSEAHASAAANGMGSVFTQEMQDELLENCPATCGVCEGGQQGATWHSSEMCGQTHRSL